MQGGGRRIAGIVDALCAEDADVLLLQECRGESSVEILLRLRDRGWCYQPAEPPDRKTYTVMAASRLPVHRFHRPELKAHFGLLWLDVELAGIKLSTLHIPVDKHEAPEPRGSFWQLVLDAARSRREEHALLVGDFNAGSPPLDGPLKNSIQTKSFRLLSGLDWLDAWRALHHAEPAYSWFSHGGELNGGAGFRLDHAFLSPALTPSLHSCRYIHHFRTQRLSDHSGLLVEMVRS